MGTSVIGKLASSGEMGGFKFDPTDTLQMITPKKYTCYNP